MKITAIDVHVLLVPDYDAGACSSAQDDLVVEVHTDEGIVGVGETDTNPWVARECIRARARTAWDLGSRRCSSAPTRCSPRRSGSALYRGSKMTGRRGALICAMGAIDMALWDIKGQALGVPVARLLGGERSRPVTPYASLLPTGRTIDALPRLARRQGSASEGAGLPGRQARGLRQRAVQPPRACRRATTSWSRSSAECREAVGPDLVLMVDVAYAWPDAQHRPGGARAAGRPRHLLHRDADRHRRPRGSCLSARSFADPDRGGRVAEHALRVPRPGRPRARSTCCSRTSAGSAASPRRVKVCRIAAERGRTIVPHCWKSGIGIAASAHLAAAASCCPYIEFLPLELAESPLRRELVVEELPICGGQILLPEKPGLGITLNRDALEKYEVGGGWRI